MHYRTNATITSTTILGQLSAEALFEPCITEQTLQLPMKRRSIMKKACNAKCEEQTSKTMK